MKKMAQQIRVPEISYKEWEYGRAIQGSNNYFNTIIVMVN
jgi:hypothetical protein